MVPSFSEDAQVRAALSCLESAGIIKALCEKLNSVRSNPLNQNLQAILQPWSMQKRCYGEGLGKQISSVTKNSLSVS